MPGSARASCPACAAALDVTVLRLGLEGRDPGTPRAGEGGGDVAPDGAGADGPRPEGSRGPRDASSPPRGRPGPGFARTWLAILGSPRVFFRALLPEGRGTGPSVGFAAAVVLPPVVVHCAAVYLLLTAPGAWPLAQLPRLEVDGGALLRDLLLLVPPSVALFVLYLATFYQAAGAIASGRRRSFEDTLEVTCFGLAPMLLGVVPVLGLAAGLVWSLILHAVAVSELHGLGRLRAALVVSAPLVVILASLVYG